MARRRVRRVRRLRLRCRRVDPPHRAALGCDRGPCRGTTPPRRVGAGRRRSRAARRRAAGAGTGVGAADAGRLRCRPPARRPRRLPAGTDCARRGLRPRPRAGAARPRATDPRPGSPPGGSSPPGAARCRVRRRGECPRRPRTRAGRGSPTAWRAACAGSGQLRLLFGPVDSGRTRLVAELAAVAVADGGEVIARSRRCRLRRWARRRPMCDPGTVVDRVIDRSRAAPLLVVVDDAEWSVGGHDEDDRHAGRCDRARRA